MLRNRGYDWQGQKDTLIARARTAKTTSQVNDMLGSITGTTSMDAFDRMQEKVEALEASAEVKGGGRRGAGGLGAMRGCAVGRCDTVPKRVWLRLFDT